MRPLPFILGLVFASTVLITNVNAIKCYVENIHTPRQRVDCDDRAKNPDFQSMMPRGSDTGPMPKKCGIAELHYAGQTVTYRDCLVDQWCVQKGVHCTTCCSENFCNAADAPDGGCSDATTSAPHVLIVAVVASAIAALGI
ncbi:hypothetical protein AAVH_03556 [Aphelenchoides avenae]|nr:hypothetical protein AAVH_03556 [Aphelenchus avenae]